MYHSISLVFIVTFSLPWNDEAFHNIPQPVTIRHSTSYERQFITQQQYTLDTIHYNEATVFSAPHIMNINTSNFSYIQQNILTNDKYNLSKIQYISTSPIISGDHDWVKDINNHETAPSFSGSNNTQQQLSSIEGGDLICRVIARSDGKLPMMDEIIPVFTNSSINYKDILYQLDDIYHAQAHQMTRNLTYTNKPSTNADNGDMSIAGSDPSKLDDASENNLVSTVRNSLQDAGFELLSRRDLDLCESLNEGYLLRLSILPDVSNLDDTIAKDFFPERFTSNGELLKDYENDFLFDKRVLVFWRGYSKEVTRGRLILPKLDYLQASLVQRMFGYIRNQLGHLERSLAISALTIYRKSTACFLYYMRHAADHIPNDRISKSFRKMVRSPYFYSAYKVLNNGTLPSVSSLKRDVVNRGNVFTLSRYGGSKTKFVGSPNPSDALNPFIICEENSSAGCNNVDSKECRIERVDRVMYDSLNRNEIRCPYDSKSGLLPPMQLLERVSIGTLVDIFTTEGRRNLFKTIFSKSALVEPTYEEVVVVWRPLPEKKEFKKFTPPKIAYELADMFDIEGLPAISKEPIPNEIPSVQIRTFEHVPMANLPAVLPKTKLVFRPADAFVFDLISILSFVAIAGSIRFDNPKLDLIALVSVGLWFIRTFFRYSNKLARYDLLVKKFLTSKLSHRNAGAVKYLAVEASSQRAKRTALVHFWLSKAIIGPVLRSHLISRGLNEIHNCLDSIKKVPIDFMAAFNDLENLNLVRQLDDQGMIVEIVREERMIQQSFKNYWKAILEKNVSNNSSQNQHVRFK